MQQNNNFLDMLNMLSVLIGLQNLQENREQSAHNDVQTANNFQAKYLIEYLNQEFAKIHIKLDKILEKGVPNETHDQ